MSYRIERVERKREPFGEYQYRIYADERLVANYWHDHKGDEHGIEFVNGRKEEWPVGRMTDFIQGGGPMPLVLTARAVAYLEQKLAK